MAGERILVVDNNVAVQDLCRYVLENAGYRVGTASNGVAALALPDLSEIDLLIVDLALREMTGRELSKFLKSDEELFQKPVLVLINDDELTDRENPNLMGANGYLKKPFQPESLTAKVRVLLEERDILVRGREHLREAADAMMRKLAEQQIQQAVEQRTQIIVERALQLVVTQVDQKARREVDSRVNQLSAEKEEELVKLTVHEVAKSMVEKLAERKVTEAMESILREGTDRAVKRVAESVLPGLARERIRENIEQMLPKEVQRRVQKEAENLVPEATERVVLVIESAAQKIVPKIARELMADLADRTIGDALDNQLPKRTQSIVSQELDAQIRVKMAPQIRDAIELVKKRVSVMMGMMVALFAFALMFIVVDRIWGDMLFGRRGGNTRASGEVTKAQPTPKPVEKQVAAPTPTKAPMATVNATVQEPLPSPNRAPTPEVKATPTATPEPTKKPTAEIGKLLDKISNRPSPRN
ncbi:MAG: response regulator [Candidatus Sumerlaeaceae bacterium]|nr:response regulator [Candidatus Sumerlaeaceae bacterium]